MHRLSLFVVLLAASLLASAQDTCGWISTAELDRLLPTAAPWSVMVGGKVGSCKFTGSGRGNAGVTVIGANQMIKANAEEAAALVLKMQGSMAASYIVEAEPTLGEHGFRYRPKDDSPGGRMSVSYFGHYKQVAVTGQLVLAVGDGHDAFAEGARAFMRAALAVADDQSATAASQCPYFDDAILRRLLPGSAYSQQVFGTNSCMAQDGAGAAMILSIMADGGPERNAAMRGSGCTWRALDGVVGASLGTDCQGGRPRAELELLLGNRVLKYSFAPGRTTTAADHQLMEALARAVVAANP